MNYSSINIKPKFCQQHNQPFLYFDQNGRNPQCQICMLEKEKLITFEQIQKQYQEIITNNNNETNLQLQQLYTFKDGLVKYRENIITSLEKSIQQVYDQIKSIEQQKQSIQLLDNIMNKYETKEDFTTYLNNNQKSNRQFKNQIIRNILLDFKSRVLKIDFLHQILNQRQYIAEQAQVTKKIQIQEVGIGQQKSLQKMEYENIQQVKFNQQVFSFEFDKKNNHLILGKASGVINVYEFKNGKIGAKIQDLEEHKSQVSCLYSMKNFQSFVSGSHDHKMILWQVDQNNKWKIQQILDDHKSFIYCITMNSKEDLLVSQSQDRTAKFWRKKAEFWNLQQTIDVGGTVCPLSLNKDGDEFILYNMKNQIIVMNIQSDQKSKIFQKIYVNDLGCILCFTIQNQFVLQQKNSDYLEIYDYDDNVTQFYQKSKVKLQKIEGEIDLFSCQYIKTINILSVNNGQFANILRVNQNGEYQLILSIKYWSFHLQAKMTDDGEYLVTWDGGQQVIQVRRLKSQEELS